MLFFRTVWAFLKDPEYRDLLITTVIILVGGTVFYHFVEDWTWIDSAYFCVITLTTVGYGDFAPQTDEGKLFTIFYLVLGIGIILSFINTIYSHFSDNRPLKWIARRRKTQSKKGN